MKRLLLLSGLLVLWIPFLSAQTKIINGTITSSAAGEGPVPGVTVQAKGTTIATATDAHGKYTITVPQETVILVFSYIGMKKQEIEIAGRNVIDVVMDYDIVGLEEIVVTTGYDIKRSPKSSSTLTQVVGGEKLSEARQTNINSALAGKVTGIQFKSQSGAKLGNTGYLRLRGGSGFGDSTSVIYVVDGTILPNSSDLNMDDIDDVSILSGPSAAAILGSQGANGAIIITTKKAKISNGKALGVELNSGFLSSFVYILPNFQNDYAGGNVTDMYRYNYKDSDPIEWKMLDGKYYPNYSEDSNWGPRMAGQEYIPWYAWYPGTKYSGKTAKLVPQPDNVRDFFDPGFTFNNNIAFYKAGNDFNIRALFGNISSTGNLPLTFLKKTTFSLKTSYKISQKLTVAANVNFFSTLTEGDFNDNYPNQSSSMLNQWFHRDIDMGILNELRGLRSPVGSLATWNHGDPPEYTESNPLLFYGAKFFWNPFTIRDFQERYTRSDRLFGDVSLNYEIIEGLEFKITYRRQQNNIRREDRIYSDIYESGEFASELPGYGYYSSSSGYSNRENYETLLSYKIKTDRISINANAGSDFFSSESQSTSIRTLNGLNVRNLFAISNSKDQPKITETISAEKYRAIFLRGDIGFGDFIFGEFTLRNDWFSSLPQDNNSVLSKSFGTSLVFTDLINFSWLNYGKLRVSWGEIPTAIDAYVYPGSVYTVNQYQWNDNFIMSTPDYIVNPQIRGDVKTQKEIGLDLKFLKNRAGLTFTYWDGTEKNIPYQVAIDGFSGYSSVYLNTGKIIKNGIDVSMNFTPLSMDNLTWEIGGTISWLIKNDVAWIADGIDNILVKSLGFGLPDLVHSAGHRWGQIFGYGMTMYNGKPVLNSNGSFFTDPDIPPKYFGSVIPDVTGGIQSSLRIMKSISIGASVDYQFGGKFLSVSELFGAYSGLSAKTSGLNDRGIPIRDPLEDGGGVHIFGVTDTQDYEANPDGDPVYTPADYYLDASSYFQSFYALNISDPFVYDLTYIKFRELTIGYDIPINKTGSLQKIIKSANVSLVAQNFWLIYSRIHDFDPSEVSYADGERAQFPGIRSIGMNLKIIF